MPKASDYRRVGRAYQQDKARRAAAKQIEQAEDLVQDARQAFYADPSAENQASLRQAEDALYELDPGNGLLT